MTIRNVVNGVRVGASMMEHALGLAAHGLYVLPVDWVVKRNEVWESAGDAYKRRIAARDGNEFIASVSAGKTPKLKNWQKCRTIDPEQIKRWWNDKHGGWSKANIGIATGPEVGLIVLDADGEVGLASLSRLSDQLMLPPTVTVDTHSGGRHLYLRCPPDADIRNSVCAVGKQLDIRGAGGFVVAPPSRGKSGGIYRFAEGLGLGEVPIAEAPEELLKICYEATKGRSEVKSTGKRRGVKLSAPQSARSVTGASEASAASPIVHLPELTTHLAAVGDHDGGMGFDSPINNAACAYFGRRSVDAPAAALKSAIRAAVESAYTKPERANVARYLSDEYLDERIEKARSYIATAPDRPAERTETCFDDEDELVDAINERAAVLMHGDKLQILLKDGNMVRYLSVTDARTALAPYKLRVDLPDNRGGQKTKLMPGFERWLESPDRRVFRDKVFDPSGTAKPDVYNTFSGYDSVPASGDWGLMQQHLFENVCRGNLDTYRAMLGWMAQLFQEPGRKVGSALVLRGAKGCGKSIVADCLRRIIGDRHARKIANPRHFTGNFNAHFDGVLLAVLEEGFYAGDYTAESVIKDFVTSNTIMIERKGVNAQEVPNFTRLLITSNAERVVPATEGERRFFVLNVGSRRARDTQFFGDLNAEMRAGGDSAMLHDLLRYEYDELVLRNPPRTAALLDQIIEGFRPEERWMYSWLMDGCLPGDDDQEWPAAQPAQIAINLVHKSYNAFVPQFRGGAATPAQIGRFMSRQVPGLSQSRPGSRQGTRDRVYILPPLETVRAKFTERYGVGFDAAEAQSDGVLFADCVEARELFSAFNRQPAALAAPANDLQAAAKAA